MNSQNEHVLEQFTRQAGAYAALVNDQQSTLSTDPLLALIAPERGHRVLDVGCGTGQFIVSLAPFVLEAVGIDLTPAMLDEARVHATAAAIQNVLWIVADSVALPVDDGSFDVVVSRSMFHHAADPAATLAEMHRACVPGGRIFVSDLSPAPEKAPAFDAIELLRDPSHRSALTQDALRALGARAGIREIVVQTAATRLPLEKVLATSFPPPGMLNHVRSLLARDAAIGIDVFGLQAEEEDGVLYVSYPTMIVGWERD